MLGSQYNDNSAKDEMEEESVNEIIVKIEMKKFQNLINNRIRKKNNLINMDIYRIYPLNKIAMESNPDIDSSHLLSKSNLSRPVKQNPFGPGK